MGINADGYSCFMKINYKIIYVPTKWEVKGKTKVKKVIKKCCNNNLMKWILINIGICICIQVHIHIKLRSDFKLAVKMKKKTYYKKQN